MNGFLVNAQHVIKLSRLPVNLVNVRAHRHEAKLLAPPARHQQRSFDFLIHANEFINQLREVNYGARKRRTSLHAHAGLCTPDE